MAAALLTGATGLIGGELCRLLVAQGWGVVALVRGEAPILGNDGIAVPSGAYAGKPPNPGEALRLIGDIGVQNCGLDPQTRSLLDQQINIIIHCAASTAFNATDDHYQKVNVAGTAHLLALGRQTPFLHVSTAYVCGTRSGVIAESGCPPETRFANGYERSKAEAERLIQRSDRPWLIARPSIVVGAAADGRIRRFDSIYGAFKLLAEGRAKTIPATTDASFNFVPVDHVAAALASLASSAENFTGQFVHICARQSMAVVDFLDTISTFPALFVPKIVPPDSFDSANLGRTEKKLFERWLTHYVPYFQRNPLFAVGNAEALTGLPSPIIDQNALRQMIGFAVNQGFIRANAHPDNDRPAARARQAPT
jgi:nucleoside-diphosphate-sugar epimerase